MLGFVHNRPLKDSINERLRDKAMYRPSAVFIKNASNILNPLLLNMNGI
jgi:hypothetical protein